MSAFKVQGWVRKDRAQRVEKVVQSVTDAYQLTFADPAEGEIPPTVLENGKLVEPYESVVELYSLPKAGSIDPDLIMAPFHFIFFGMMLSDAGYGLVLTVMLYFALKKFKPTGFARQLALVIFFGSISTVLWGAMFGGWFGLEWKPLLFVPMKEPLKMLALCFGLGAIHLVAGMLVKVYMLLRDGDVMGAVCDQISWLIMFLGFFLMALVPGPIGKYLAWLGAGIIILFGGREKEGHRQPSAGRPADPVQHQRLPERPAELFPDLRPGAGHRRHRHGHQYRGPDAVGARALWASWQPSSSYW